jgi:hypothetical protein
MLCEGLDGMSKRNTVMRIGNRHHGADDDDGDGHDDSLKTDFHPDQ